MHDGECHGLRGGAWHLLRVAGTPLLQLRFNYEMEPPLWTACGLLSRPDTWSCTTLGGWDFQLVFQRLVTDDEDFMG